MDDPCVSTSKDCQTSSAAVVPCNETVPNNSNRSSCDSTSQLTSDDVIEEVLTILQLDKPDDDNDGDEDDDGEGQSLEQLVEDDIRRHRTKHGHHQHHRHHQRHRTGRHHRSSQQQQHRRRTGRQDIDHHQIISAQENTGQQLLTTFHLKVFPKVSFDTRDNIDK